MSDEHFLGCSSFTTDDMISKLDDLLWNHENSYLYERGHGIMSDNVRDTQFQGFAKALIHDLNDVSTTTYASYDEAKKAYELTIARRAYDFAVHVTDHTRGAISRDPKFVLKNNVPDMTELPKESSHEQ